MNTTYYIETIDCRVRERIFKHQYGGSPYNVALFLIFPRNTSIVRTNLTNKRSAQNAGNGISWLQISNIFGGRMLPEPLWKTSTPPPLTNQARSAGDVNFPVRLYRGHTCRGGSSLNCKEGCRFSMGWCMRESYCRLSSAACNATIPTLPLFEMAESACSPFCYVLRFAAVTNYNLQAASTFLTTFLKQ